MTVLDEPRTIEATTEMRDFARVLKAAIGALVFYWVSVQHLPPQHPYRHAARMIESYLERRYDV